MRLRYSKKNIWIISLFIFAFCISFFAYNAYADDETVTTTVSVNNAAPTFATGGDPEEYELDKPGEPTAAEVVSSSTYPTNEGDDVDFQATADDSDGDDYYLAICKTNAITANNNAAPTCDGGSWCISSQTTDESQATCSYITQNTDAEENAWYAFVCDHSSGSDCSSVSQGSGDSGSPFVVNHKPTMSSLTNDGPKDPNGGDLTFTSDGADSDLFGTTDDDLYLLICSTNSITQATPYSLPACGADQIALGTAVTSNPTAVFTIPAVYPDGTFDGYGFVYDEHYASVTTANSINSQWTINNIAPTVAIDSFNTTTLTLTENTTTDLIASVTVTDANSCQDVTSGGSVVIDFLGNWLDGDYSTDNDHTLCDQSSESDPDECYAEISCTVDSGTDPCAGTSDNQVAYSCTVPVEYYAEATGTGASDTNHVNGNWYAYITANDNNSITATDSATNLSVNLLIAFSTGTSIDYGALDAGQTSANQTVLVTTTGNTIIDTELSGTDMTSSGDSITVDNQEYAAETFTHGSLPGVDLSSTPTELELNVAKTYWSTTVQSGTENIYWSLFVPVGTPSGNYTGSNTLTAVQGEW